MMEATSKGSVAAVERLATLLLEVPASLDAAAVDVAGTAAGLRLQETRDDVDEALALVDAMLRAPAEGSEDDVDRRA